MMVTAAQQIFDTTASNPGEDLATYWAEYIRIKSEMYSRLRCLSNTVRHLEHPELKELRCRDSEEVAEEATELVKTLVWHARKRFGAAGIDAPINAGDYTKRFIPRGLRFGEQETWAKLDLKAVWKALEEEHGGGSGEQAAYRFCAERLKSDLGLRDSSTHPVMARGRLVTKFSVYSETHGAGRSLSVHSQDRLDKFFEALSGFLRWNAEPAADEIRGHYLCHAAWRTPIELRRADQFGPVDVRTFFQHIEVGIAQKTAEKLRVFLAKYGDQDA